VEFTLDFPGKLLPPRAKEPQSHSREKREFRKISLISQAYTDFVQQPFLIVKEGESIGLKQGHCVDRR